jgi:hypothetical protein
VTYTASVVGYHLAYLIFLFLSDIRIQTFPVPFDRAPLLYSTSCPIYFCVWRVPSARPLIPFSFRPLFVCKFSRHGSNLSSKLPSQKNFTPMFLLLCLLPYSCLCAGHPSTVTTWGRWEWWRRFWRITSCSTPHPHTRQVLRSGRNIDNDDNWYRIQQLCTQITSTYNFCKQLSPYLKTFKEPRNRFRQAGNRFLGSLTGLQMRTLTKWRDPCLANLAD